jgi:hypothetical protein
VITSPPVEDRDVLEHPLAAVNSRARLDGDGLERAARSLLTTIVASDSPSTSSATISSGLPA